MSAATAAASKLAPSSTRRLALFGVGATTSLVTSGLLFRDLADLSQWYLKCDRNNVFWTFDHRHGLAAASLGGMAASTLATFVKPAAVPKSAWAVANGVSLFMLYSGYVNPELMMRPRNTGATYVSTHDIKNYMKPNETVIVMKDPESGDAKAFPDVQLLRPHVVRVGHIDQDQVVMTYCG